MANSIRGGPAAAGEERRAHRFSRSVKVARMDPFKPGIRGGFHFFRNNSQYFLDAPRAMHDSLDKVPLENYAVDRIGGQTEYFLALGKTKFRLFALGDIARIDHDTVDQRIGECRDAA